MRALLKRLAVLSAASVVTLSILGGCDAKSSADQDVKDQLIDAANQLASGGDDSRQVAKELLEKAAGNSEASAGARAQAKAALAQYHVDVAGDVIRQIDLAELNLSRVSFDLGQNALQVDTAARSVESSKLYDPKAVRDQIATAITDAQGAADKPAWFTHDKSVIPTQAAAKQRMSELQAQIAKLQDEARVLTDERTKVMESTAEATRAADELKGQPSLEGHKHASALRQQSADLFTQIDNKNAAIVPIQTELAIVESQLKYVEQVVKSLEDQRTQLDAGWQAIQQQSARQGQLAKDIVSSSVAAPAPTTGPAIDNGANIALKAQTIARLAAEIRKLRDESQSNLDTAAKLFGDSMQAGTEVTQTYNAKISLNPDRPEAISWKALVAVTDSQEFRVRQAAVRRVLGGLYLSQAASASARLRLTEMVKPIIERAGATTPTDLSIDALSKERNDALNLADEQYKQAEGDFADLAEGSATQEVKNGAAVERILNLYGWAQAARLKGDETNASARLADAIARRKAAFEASIKLPVLPAEFGPPPTPPAPATEPASQPADGAATTQEAAPAAASPDEAAIRTVAASFADALARNDIEGAKTFCVIDPGYEDVLNGMATFSAEQKKLCDAAIAKFPDAADRVAVLIPDTFGRYRTGTIRIEADAAFFDSGAEKTATKDAMKSEEVWKMYIGTQWNDQRRAAIAKYGAIVPGILAELDAGKFADLDALVAAIDAAVKADASSPDAAQPPATPGTEAPTEPPPMSPGKGRGPG